MRNQAVSVAVTIASFSLCACCGGTPERREPFEQAARRAEVQRLTSQLGRDGQDASLLRKLANEYWALGDFDAAQRALERALAVEPNPDAQSTLVSLLYQRGRYVEARSLSEGLTAPGTPTWLTNLREEFAALMKSPIRDARLTELRRVGTDLLNSIDMAFVEVPGTSFIRGDERGEADHRPARRIEVGPYRIGKYEVTRSQFKRFLDETGYRFVPRPSDAFAPELGDYPVVGASWEDAQAFTMWLSGRETAAYRLPTEAEWELAARGTQGYREPWGNERGRAGVDANWGRTSIDELKSQVPPVRPIGSFLRDRSPFGAFDMAGNVREWCLDEYDATYYSWSPTVNPFGPVEEIGGGKVQRGGSWNDPGPADFAIRRSHAGRNQRYTGYGFRVVREVEVPRHLQQGATAPQLAS